MNIVYTVREGKAPKRGAPPCLKENEIAKQSSCLETPRDTSSSSLVSPCVPRTLKNSVQEVSTEGAVGTMSSTPMEVTPHVVPSPPLISPASPSLSSPPLFSPPFFSTPTTPHVPSSPQKLPSNTVKPAKTSESAGNTSSSRVHTSLTPQPTACGRADPSKSIVSPSSKGAQNDKIAKCFPSTSAATVDETWDARSFSKFGKFSSPSPPILELCPLEDKSCSAVNTSLVSVTKEQDDSSTLGPPLLLSQASPSASSLSTHHSPRKSSQSSQHASPIKCSSHTAHLGGSPINISTATTQASTLPPPTMYSKYAAHQVPSSSMSQCKPSPASAVTDPSRLMHSVHAILNKSPSSSFRRQHQQTPTPPSTPLRWTPVVEHKASPASTTSHQPQWCLQTPPSVAASNSSSRLSISDTKQIAHQPIVTKGLHATDTVRGLKAELSYCKLETKSVPPLPIKGVENNSGKPCVKDEIANTQMETKKCNKTESQDMLSHVDMKGVHISAKQCGTAPVSKDLKCGTLTKGDILYSGSESKNCDIKPGKNSCPKREEKYNGSKVVERKKHVKCKSDPSGPAQGHWPKSAPEHSIKTYTVPVKSEIGQPSQGKAESPNGKHIASAVPTTLVRAHALPTYPVTSSPTSTLNRPEGQEESNELNNNRGCSTVKLQRLHSHPGQNIQSRKVQEIITPPQARSVDDEAVSPYIPKFQKHKNLYLSKRSVSCIEDSTGKTNENSQQMMEKRNWKKRKLSTLDFDPSSSRFVQKQDKLQSPNGSLCSDVAKKGATPGPVASDCTMASAAAGDDSVKSTLGAGNLQGLYQSGLGGSSLSPLGAKFSAHKSGEESGRLAAPVVEPSSHTVSCLPMTGHMTSGPKYPSVFSCGSSPGHVSSNSYSSLAGDNRHNKTMKLVHPSDIQNSKIPKNSSSSTFYGSRNSTSYCKNISSSSSSSNNNNNNNSNNNNSNNYKVSNINNNNLNSRNNSSVCTKTNSNNAKRSSLVSSPPRSSPANKVGSGQSGTRFLYHTPGVAGAQGPEHPVSEPNQPSQNEPNQSRDKTGPSCASSCISIEVASSQCSPSDGASSSTSSTSPAANVTSPGTEDRADNTALLEMQVTPSCGKSYLSPPCSGSKGLPLDLSSNRNRK